VGPDIRTLYERRIPVLSAVASELERGLAESLAETPHVDRVYFRAKGISRFIEKACEGAYVSPLRQIEDQVSGRVLVFFLSDIEVVRTRASARWPPVEEAPRQPARDAEFGYESFHQIFQIPEHVKPIGWSKEPDMPVTFELQIRTLFMHAYAEPEHDFGYRDADSLTREQRRTLGWIAASAWGADRAYDALVEGLPVTEGGPRTAP
jgi:ppGpp synthetase/RelA/SpoT-type nucleotidyltranferase